MGLDPAAWHDLFGAVATASAALLGLFIVAISLHLRVEEHAIVHNQARVALLILALHSAAPGALGTSFTTAC